MEIKKGDRFRCNIDYLKHFTKDKEYTCFDGGFIKDDEGDIFELKGSSFQNGFEPVKQDSPTSPSHYKAYDVESIEMMIRIWGKQRVAEWCEITAMKYRLRAGLKGDASECLAKEQWYLSKWKELRNDVTG